MSEAVLVETEINSPIARVWEALTDSDTLGQWMLFKHNTFKPEKGHRFTFSGAEGFDQTIACEVLEIDPPQHLSYSWETAGVDGKPHATVVNWTLRETPNGTHVAVKQTGFRTEATQETAGAQYGWTHMLEQLRGVVTDA